MADPTEIDKILSGPEYFHCIRLKATMKKEKLGWSDFERTLIMQYFYQRGKRRAKILADYGWRLNKND